MRMVRTIVRSLTRMSFYGKWRMILLSGSGFWRTFEGFEFCFRWKLSSRLGHLSFCLKISEIVCNVLASAFMKLMVDLSRWTSNNQTKLLLDEQIIDTDLDRNQPYAHILEGCVKKWKSLFSIDSYIQCQVEVSLWKSKVLFAVIWLAEIAAETSSKLQRFGH
jgi:hypothetical protein